MGRPPLMDQVDHRCSRRCIVQTAGGAHRVSGARWVAVGCWSRRWPAASGCAWTRRSHLTRRLQLFGEKARSGPLTDGTDVRGAIGRAPIGMSSSSQAVFAGLTPSGVDVDAGPACEPMALERASVPCPQLVTCWPAAVAGRALRSSAVMSALPLVRRGTALGRPADRRIEPRSAGAVRCCGLRCRCRR